MKARAGLLFMLLSGAVLFGTTGAASADETQTVIVPLPPLPQSTAPSAALAPNEALPQQRHAHHPTVRPTSQRTATTAKPGTAKPKHVVVAAADRARAPRPDNAAGHRRLAVQLAARDGGWRQGWRGGRFGWWRVVGGVLYYIPSAAPATAADTGPGPQIASALPAGAPPAFGSAPGGPPMYGPAGPRLGYNWPRGPGFPR